MSFPNMFTKNAAANMTTINVERTIDGVKDALSLASDAATNRTISGYVYSSESFDEDRYRVVSNTMDQLSESLTSMSAKLGLESYSNSQIKSAVGAAIGVTDVHKFATSKLNATNVKPGFSAEGRAYTTVVGMEGLADAFETRVAVENFDERDNRNAEVLSVTYNLEAS